MYVHTRVCNKNKQLENNRPLQYFVVKGQTYKGCRKTGAIKAEVLNSNSS